ncbi:MAG: bifunctional phosphoribosylaminoimidazolecarboxamide formyltransferase/IMP cyclohydrolase [candidate division NC10 bacterium]|nr:bifunctional phosphoribosylaminoimidazolecarboxamide formyltransferase/IMP cyclohydrolase [candidate division NC10 bacterium]
MKIERALLSVSDKTGILSFAKGLVELGVALVSTGGTAKFLQEAGLDVTEVSTLTGSPEMLDGRVKTLHPAIHAGILAKRDDPSHQRELEKHGFPFIDLVVVNLYPFEATIAKGGCTLEEAIEQIDIGGVALIRSAAKNPKDVAVIVDADDHGMVLEELKVNGTLSKEIRFALAKKAFAHTARYDALIANYLEGVKGRAPRATPEGDSPPTLTLHLEKVQDLRYGENPHQHAAFYTPATSHQPPATSVFKQVHGRELSSNNLLDLDAAWRFCREFEEPAAVIIKHNNPCGAAVASRFADAFRQAKAADPVSAYGGVIGINGPLDEETAQEIAQSFVEVVIATAYTEEALAILRRKKNLRLLEVRSPKPEVRSQEWEIRTALGGLLVQQPDDLDLDDEQLTVVTKRAPTEEEREDLCFAWRVAKHVRSNAIVLASRGATIGIGAGQMSRVDSVRLAIMKANVPTKGTCLASDGFFPFRDGIDVAAEAGVSAVIQPGGSIRDEEVIQAADEHGMAMVFTGIRHFRH